MLELFHRFMFLVLEDIIYGSIHGIHFSTRRFYPILNLICSDQREERAFFCLKTAGSFKDCTLCTMQSRCFVHNHRSENDSRNSIDDEDADISDVDSGFSFSSDGSSLLSYNDQRSDPYTAQDGPQLTSDEVRSRQFTSSPAPSRTTDVVYAQLCLASNRMNKRFKTAVFISTKPSVLDDMSSYLQRESALEFPPFIAAMYGLGARPFRLYRNIAFDKLHVFDLGHLRVLADMAHTCFRNASGLPMSTAVAISN